jgi:hypothetical protein
MTGDLRTTLNTRADALDTWDVDLDAIVRAGDRRLRRRRAALAGGVAGVLAAVVGMSALVAHDHISRPLPADQDAKPLTYAVGSVIHTGTGPVDVGIKVESMVQTTHGFVFSGPDQKVYEEEDGDVQQIGHLANSHTHLVVGDDGLVTGWWDGSRIQTWPGRNGRTNSFAVADHWSAESPPSVRAISDAHLWFWNGQKTAIAEVEPFTSSMVWFVSGAGQASTIQDVSGNAALVRAGHEGPGHEGVGLAVIGTDLQAAGGVTWPDGVSPTTAQPQVRDISSGHLAPDGRHWFTQDNDEFAVFDSATGQRQDPAHPGFAFAAPYQWLGNDTMAVLALKGMSDHESISLLTCHVSTNDCEVTAEDIGYFDEVAIPAGEAFGD